MKFRKRTMALAGLAIVAVAVAVSATAGAAGTKNAEAPYTIGLSNGYYGNGARVQLAAEFKAYAALPTSRARSRSS